MAFVNDSFTDTDGVLLENHTGETGATWTKHPGHSGSAEIDTNRWGATSGNGVYLASGVPASAEYDVTAVLFTVDVGPNGNVGVAGRSDTLANTYYRAYYNTNGDKWAVDKRVAGASTVLGESGEAIGNGESRTFRLELRNGAKKLFVEDIEIISTADNVITDAGRVGTWQNSGADILHLDNFTASDPAAGFDAETDVSAGVGIGATVATTKIATTSIFAGIGIGAVTPATKIAVANVSAGLGTLASIATLRISLTDVHAGIGLGATVSVDDTPSASVTAGFGIGATVSTLAIRSTAVFAGVGIGAETRTAKHATTVVHAGIGIGASVWTVASPVDYVLPFSAVLSSYPQVEGVLSSHAEVADAVLVSLPEDP